MSDYHLRLLVHATITLTVIIASVVLALNGAITGADSMLVMMAAAGFGSTGTVAMRPVDAATEHIIGGP